MQGNGATARTVARPQSVPAPATLVVRKGRQPNPKRFLVYGVEGVGKSTLAAGAPGAVFLCPEDGVDELDVTVLLHPKTEQVPRTWQEVLDVLTVLLVGDHAHKTLVVDTIDWLEPLMFAHVCKLSGKASITDFGYGDGYKASVDLWRIFTARCDELRHKRGMSIVLLGHSMVKEFKDPGNDAYERYQLKLYKDSAGWLREWSDAVLFANYDVATKENKRGRVRAFDTGARFLFTQRTAAYDAKNRLDLPPRVPLSWEALAEAIEEHAPISPTRLRRQLDELATKLDDGDRTKLEGAIARVGEDAVKLSHLVDWATARVAIAAEDEEDSSARAGNDEDTKKEE
jgi:hypothetical protein